MWRTVRQGCFALLAWCYVVAGVTAQPALPRLVINCGGTFHLCGYRDSKTKAEVIPHRFERAFPFSEGMAGVRINGLYGYIDETGAIIIEPRFDMAGMFYLGRAEVVAGNRAGIIDRQGNFIVAPQFARAVPFTKDVILAREAGPSDDPQRELLTPVLLSLLPQSRVGLYSLSAGWLTRPDYYVLQFETEGRGLIWATTQDQRGGPYGLLRADGTWQVEPQYTYGTQLSDGRANVRIIDRDNPREPIPELGNVRLPAWLDGAVDPDGRLVVPLRPWRLGAWANGLGVVREDRKEGLIDKDGRLIGGRLFDKVKPAGTGDINQVLLDGKWVGLDRDGHIVANPDDGTVVVQCPTGVKLVRQYGKVQVVGPDNQPTIPFLLEESTITDYSKLDCSQPVMVKLEKKAGSRFVYVGADGRLLGDPPFEVSYGFKDGFSVVERDGKRGIIDPAGHVIVDLQYDGLFPDVDHKGRYVATRAGRKSYIDAAGVEQPPPSHHSFRCGTDGVMVIGSRDPSGAVTWGLADEQGHVIVKPVHRAVQCFMSGVAWVPVDAKRRWCPVGPDGAMRDHPDCEEMRYPFFSHHGPVEHFADDPYEQSVRWTQAFLEYYQGLRATHPY